MEFLALLNLGDFYKDKNWVAFKGEHMDLVLDLGETQNIKSIEMEFLNVQAQANWHQLILPKHVTYSISKDGLTYEKPMKVNNPHNPNPAENPDITKVPFHPFNIELENKECRYIKKFMRKAILRCHLGILMLDVPHSFMLMK